MKILLICTTLLASIMCGLSEPPTSGGETFAPGRYQVVTGKLEYSTPSLSGSATNTTINSAIMIDTATGKTWFLEPILREVHKNKMDFVPDRQWSEIKLRD